MKTRESEYIVDRLNADIIELERSVDALLKQNQELDSECKFGAMVSLLIGFVLGLTFAAVMVWSQ